MKKQIRGSICLLLCTVIWGAAFVAQSVGMDHIGPFTFQAVRCLLALIGLLPVIVIADRFKKDGKTFQSRWADKKLWRTGILCGIPLFLATSLQQIGLMDTDAGKSAFLTAMYIVIVPVIGLLLRKPMSGWVPLSVVLAVVGLYCLSCVGVTRISFGDAVLLGCALMFAVQIIFIDLWAGELDPLRLNWIQAFVCAVFSAIAMLLFEEPTLQTVWACRLPLAYAGILSLGVAYALQIMGQKDLPPAAASLIMSLESVFAVLFGCLLLEETMSKWEWIGCGLMFTAVILSQLPSKRAKKPRDAHADPQVGSK